MKIFEGKLSTHVDKFNFVDDNDVYVGYDKGQDCCEYADWYIAEEITPYQYERDGMEKNIHDVEVYVFDRGFFEEVTSTNLDEGGMVAFKLVASGKPDLYLHLFNCHNGYYGHGFVVEHGGEIVKEGYLSMLHNQSIPEPTNTPPIEMVSPPIDWMFYVTMENVILTALVIFVFYILYDEQKEVLKDE